MLLFLAMLLLLPSAALAAYDDATVVQVDPPSSQGTVEITAVFTGPGEPDMKRTVIAKPHWTKAEIDDWSINEIVYLNQAKVVKAAVKVGDKLAVTKVVTP